MTDRISQMSREELEAATRELVKVASLKTRQWQSDFIDTALRPFQPTTLDKVRELLKAEGWVNIPASGRGDGIKITGTEFCEFWSKS